MYRLNTKIRLTILCLSGFELYSRWVPLISHTKSLIFSTVACNATPARHICFVNYITPFPRVFHREFGPPVLKIGKTICSVKYKNPP